MKSAPLLLLALSALLASCGPQRPAASNPAPVTAAAPITMTEPRECEWYEDDDTHDCYEDDDSHKVKSKATRPAVTYRKPAARPAERLSASTSSRSKSSDTKSSRSRSRR